jgi:hypothetical protein
MRNRTKKPKKIKKQLKKTTPAGVFHQLSHSKNPSKPQKNNGPTKTKPVLRPNDRIQLKITICCFYEMLGFGASVLWCFSASALWI